VACEDEPGRSRNSGSLLRVGTSDVAPAGPPMQLRLPKARSHYLLTFISKSQHREGLERCRCCPFRVAARKAKGQATPPYPVTYVSQCPAPPSRHLAPLPSASPSQAPHNPGNFGHPSQAPQRRISFFLLFPLSAKLPARKFCPAGGLLRLCSLHGGGVGSGGR
jgi:hypothetical protein